MHVVQVNYAYDRSLTDPDALLDRYTTLTGWAEAVLAAGASRSSVVQRFSRDARRERDGVAYHFRADRHGPTPAPWSRSRRIGAAVAALEPDIVHVNGLGFSVPTRSLRRALPRVPLVVQDHANGLHPDPLRRAVARFGLAAADGVMFSAAALARPWRDAGVLRDQPVFEVLESGARLRPLPRDAARRQTGLRGSPAVLWVGRLNATKDPLTVLAGFAGARGRLPNAHLTMAYHTSELLPRIRAWIAARPALAGCIHLIGRVPHDAIAAYYSAADLFVSGSHREGSGYALLEAMACGTVPIVTDIPTFRRITDDGRLGLLFPAGDPAGAAAAFDRAPRLDLAALRARVASHFDRRLSWPAVGREALRVYREIAARHPVPKHATDPRGPEPDRRLTEARRLP